MKSEVLTNSADLISFVLVTPEIMTDERVAWLKAHIPFALLKIGSWLAAMVFAVTAAISIVGHHLDFFATYPYLIPILMLTIALSTAWIVVAIAGGSLFKLGQRIGQSNLKKALFFLGVVLFVAARAGGIVVAANERGS